MDADHDKIKNSLLDKFADDLWLKRRLELQAVIDVIEKSENSNYDDDDKSLSSSARWIRFIHFLENECSGLLFNDDKQWSELMNLMQISKKLNHRSVKFKDILRNKQLIEANGVKLRKLNESVRLCQTIGSALDQLELILQRECNLILRPDSRQQLDELLNSKSFLENRCRSTILTLQLELEVEVNVSCVPQVQCCREKANKLMAIISCLGKLLDDLQSLYYLQLQLNPLINADQDYGPETRCEARGSDQLDNSVGTCKRIFAEVQEFCKKLMIFMVDLASQTNRKKVPPSLSLLKLVNLKIADSQLVKSDLLVSGLEESLKKLIECRRILDSVIHQLRLEFGRFYFVSDLELLSIIALNSRLVLTDHNSSQQSKNLLGKLFNNSIESFVVDEKKQHLIGIRSPYNEIIIFPQAEVGFVPIKKSVNLYSVEIVRILNEMMRKLRKTLQYQLNKSLISISNKNIDWTLPVQLMIVAEGVKFCQLVEATLQSSSNSSSLAEVLKFYEDRFKELSSYKVDDNEKLGKFKLSAAVSITVHFISTLGSLKDTSTTSGVEGWQWVKLARYYRSPEDGRILIKIADTCFEYKFDFLAPQANDLSCGPQAGGYKRLINTKITERCLLAASQSIGNFRLGSSPYGPAGSGKTETIKALGYLLGCQVIVHNCDESNDGRSLDQLVWGLAHTGLWGCFDEFNRLSVSALSSISASLELVQASIRESKRVVELPDGRMMPVDEATAFFVTMNPADPNKGYRGRRRLPANLKQLFLPIAMMRVQIGAIVSESLLAMGAELEDSQYCLDFQEAKLLAGRLAKFMENLTQELIQKKCTCVWDLRMVLAIFKRLKLLIGASSKCTGVGGPPKQPTSISWSHLQSFLIKSLNNEITPRLSRNCDLGVFQHLLEKNFPSQEETTDNVSQLVQETDSEISFREKLKEASIKLFPDQEALSSKIELLSLQLKYQLDSRSGIILLGPPRTGKSTSWRLLQSIMANSVDYIPLNPRACSREDLFGFVDPASGKWIDGLLTARVRQALQMLEENKDLCQVWLVLDGPIDPDWIETFNSVLDDNQVLTLSSGERLNFSPALNKSIKLLIESDSLEFASPASISRLGLVLHERELSSPDNGTENDSLANLTFNKWNQEEQEMAIELTRKERKRKPQVSLVVMSGCNFDQKRRSDLIRNIVTSSLDPHHDSGDLHKVIEYNCSPMSNCNHLMELIASSSSNQADLEQSSLFIINNVQLIEEEDQWKVKSFMELMRFLVTYGGFYDKQHEAMIKIKATFVVTVDPLDHLDSRTLVQGCSIQLNNNNDEEQVNDENFAEMIDGHEAGEFLLAIYQKQQQQDCNQSYSIITLSNSERFSGRRSSIIEKLNQKFNILTFRNSKEAKRSVETLEELLNKCRPGGGMKLFLLSDLECKLMNPELKANLFHQLNRLKANPKLGKFVYLTYQLGSPEKINAATFWRSLGPVILMDSRDYYVKTTREKQRKELIRKELSINETDWLHSKVEKFLDSQMETNQLIDNHRSKLYISTILSLIKRSRVELDSQRGTFEDGLSRLGEFERNVERVKSRCQREEMKLEKRKEDIGELVKTIDRALEESRGQRIELNELKQQQVRKRKELELQSEQLNAELAQVTKLVDKSKLEISQFLKPEALNEIKALRSPPTTIKDILDVLFTLLRIEDCSWPSMRAYLTKYSLKDQLTSYNFQKNLDESLLGKVSALMQTKSDSFTTQQAARASKAVVPILGWIKATLEYGKVLIRLKPLQNQMELLEQEASHLSGMARGLEVKLAEVDVRIDENSKRLSKLQMEYDESQRIALAIRVQLDKSQLARQNLDGQIGRWRQRLALVRSLLVDDGKLELIGLCSLLVSMILFYNHDDEKDNQLEEWIQIFGLKIGSRVELIHKMVNLTMVNQPDLNLAHLATQEGKADSKCNQILQLLCIRLHLELAPSSGTNFSPSLPVPFLDIGLTSGNRNEGVKLSASQEEVVQYLAFKSLLCERSNVIIIKCDQQQQQINDDCNWIQSIEMALRFDRLVLVELNDGRDSSLDLDIIDHVYNKIMASNSLNNNNNNNYKQLRLLLLGKLNKHSAIKDLVRPIRLLTGSSSLDEIQSSVMEFLLNTSEPKLSSVTRELELEFQRKQQDCRLGELRLLNRLATMRIDNKAANDDDDYDDDSSSSLQEGLVSVLSELHKLNESLESVLRKLNDKQAEIRNKQEEYKNLVEEISKFYLNHLANLGQRDKFYNFPLETYLHLLIGNDHPKNLVKSKKPFQLNYGQIVKRAKQPMRPEFRVQFEFSLLMGSKHASETKEQDGQSETTSADFGKESSLQSVIEDLLIRLHGKQVTTTTNNSSSNQPALMVVLHEPTKSSPQLEIDEFFHKQDHKSHEMTYTKIYATNDSYERLEASIRKVLKVVSSDCNTNNNNNKSVELASKKMVHCVCIANAHLASKWLNLHLVRILLSSSSAAKPEVTCRNKILIILVGESCSDNADDGVEFDSSLLDFAQVKYWHDDSMLELTDRFKLFHGSLLSSGQVLKSYLKLNNNNNNDSKEFESKWAKELLKLAEEMVLFHIVCQEKAKIYSSKSATPSKPIQGAKMGWSCQNYSFDYDQLCLALKTLGNLQTKQFKNLVVDRRKLYESGNGSSFSNREIEDYFDTHLRVGYCHYLADFVYGSRMETLEDEQTLSRLVERFLGSRESGRLQMEKFRQLEATCLKIANTNNNNNNNNSNVRIDYEQQLENLVI